MIWTPWKREPKADPLKEAEHTTDDLKKQLRDMRERLLRETVKNTVQKDDG